MPLLRFIVQNIGGMFRNNCSTVYPKAKMRVHTLRVRMLDKTEGNVLGQKMVYVQLQQTDRPQN